MKCRTAKVSAVGCIVTTSLVVTGRLVFWGKVFKRNIDLCFGTLSLVTDRLRNVGKKSVFKTLKIVFF